MARSCCCVLILLALANVADDGPVLLRETHPKGRVTSVVIELAAEGSYSSPEKASEPAAKGSKAKPIPVKIQGRNEFVDRVLRVDADGRVEQSLRHVTQAAVAVNNELRRVASDVRPEVALLVAERRGEQVAITSAGGPLTRFELDIVHGPADPLTLDALLPAKAVNVGDRWKVGDLAARGLSEFDRVTSNQLEAKLESLDAGRANIKIGGFVQGFARGGEGKITIAGTMVFDRENKLISELALTREETRGAGPVELGLEMKSTLKFERKPVAAPGVLDDSVVEGVLKNESEGRELLTWTAPGGFAAFLHDRDWFVGYDDARQAVLKRLDPASGRLSAQLNVSVGPKTAKGRHLDADKFLADLKKALGARLEAIVSAGPFDLAESGSFGYRIAVAGNQGELGVLWYYYLVASPDGDQLILTFTLPKDEAERFGDHDQRFARALQWRSSDPNNDQKPGK